MAVIIGREEEKRLLQRLINSDKAELLAVYGRRRVGKTFLIHSYLREHIVFNITGTQNATLASQLEQFAIALGQAYGVHAMLKPPVSWVGAFNELRAFIATKTKDQKLVLFFDELPWLDSRKSGFLKAFDFFWNNWACFQNELLVIVCGSSASWIINKIINNKGGLHNRITARMPLKPFSLAETEAYLRSLGCVWDRYKILEIYMVFGGIPHYLNNVSKGQSVDQVINNSCFKDMGNLKDEFTKLYKSLFDLADNHIKVVKVLSAATYGLSRSEIIKKSGISSGGGITKVLNELMDSGFIKEFPLFGMNSQNALFKLVDEYSIFYLKFMDNAKQSGIDIWNALSKEQSYKIWRGIAFEALCFKHLNQILKGLEINAIVEAYTWRYTPPKNAEYSGAQIDLLLDRRDGIINACEIKFYNDIFIIDKSYAVQLEKRIETFKKVEKITKTVFPTLITALGVKPNEYSKRLVQQEIDMDCLFRT